MDNFSLFIYVVLIRTKNKFIPEEDLKGHEEIPEIVMMVYFPAPVLAGTNPTKQLKHNGLITMTYCVTDRNHNL